MSDERIVAILSEIRDLQRQHIENYKVALANQEKALEVQKESIRRSKKLFIAVGGIVLALYLLPFFWWAMNWGLRCALRR